MPDLRIRSQEAEIMDDFDISFAEYRETYRQLQTVNSLTFTYYPTLKFMDYIWMERPGLKCLKILDIGCGNGDMLRKIDQLSIKRNRHVKLVGVDLNEKAIQSARLANPDKGHIIFLAGNVFDGIVKDDFDIVINSLVMHHLSSEMIIRMLQWMSENARVGWFINDLHRHRVPYYFIKYFVRLLGMNRMICNDAPLSVARGFSRKDWSDLIQKAELDMAKVTISWYWNFRFGVMYEQKA